MLYKIGKFAKIVDTSIRTLRYYDEIDLLKPIEIDLFTGYRYYSKEQIDDFNIIKSLQYVGFSLEEIKEGWNKFDNDFMISKRNELLNSIDDVVLKIKEIDELRSKIVDGKIFLRQPIKKTNAKMKTIFKKEM
ncbi:MAG: MerR family transcriptional regulator [bacterium]|nr:MerR family transcriptional regulator [bacterium]